MSRSTVQPPSEGQGKQATKARRFWWLGHLALTVAVAALALELAARGTSMRAIEIAAWSLTVVALLAVVMLQIFRVDGHASSLRALAPYGVLIVGVLCVASATLLAGETVSIVFAAVGTASCLVASGWFVLRIRRSRAVIH